MQKTIKGFVILLIILFLSICLSDLTPKQVFAQNQTYSYENVIEISTGKQLCEISSQDNKDKNFILINDIDLDIDTSWHDYVIDFKNGWLPIDTYDNSGTFDGGGYTINNLYINREDIDFVGFFSRTSLKIKNLNISTKEDLPSVFAVNGNDKAGVLAGICYSSVDNVHINGSVKSKNIAGGIVANMYGDIDNCSFNGKVEGRIAGGVIGISDAKNLSNLLVYGNVTGHIAGGLIGEYCSLADLSKLSTSYSGADVTAKTYDTTVKRIGGLIGIRESGTVIGNCYSVSGIVQIALGAADGVTGLTLTERQNKDSYSGFSFVLNWHFNDSIKKVELRKIAVSSNTLQMSGVSVKIAGDRNYYLNGEIAVLKIFTNGRENIGIKSMSIDGIDVTDNIINGEYEISAAQKQININFKAWYLVKVETNRTTRGGSITLSQDRVYYSLNEDIIVNINAKNGFKFNGISASFNGQDIAFTDLGSGKYKAEITGEYNSSSILYINAQFKANIWIWVAIGCGVAGLIIIIGIIFFIRRGK